jgi:hypothetical protein
MESAILVHVTPKDETVNSQDYCDVLYERNWARDLKIGAVKNWLKTQPKTFFLTVLKETYETLEPVRWSREGLHWQVILVSFLYI